METLRPARGIAARRILAALVAACALASPAAAAAPAPPSEDRAPRERAFDLVDEGVKLARAAKYADAVAKFAAANRIYPHPEIQHNLARAYEEVGRRDGDSKALRSAHHWFTQALKQDYTHVADGRQRLGELEQTLRRGHARLTVRTTPSDVSVTLTFPDGEVETHGSVPFRTWIPVGATRVIASNPGFKTASEVVTLTAGEDRELDLVLAPLPRQGYLQVNTNVDGAEIRIDGQLVGLAPIESAPYPAGVYRMTLSAEGYRAYDQEIAVQPDQLTTISAVMKPASPGQSHPLKVTSLPPDAAVYLDEDGDLALKGRTPLVIEAGAGKHTIVVAHEGFAPFRRTLDLVEAGELHADLEALVPGADTEVRAATILRPPPTPDTPDTTRVMLRFNYAFNRDIVPTINDRALPLNVANEPSLGASIEVVDFIVPYFGLGGLVGFASFVDDPGAFSEGNLSNFVDFIFVVDGRLPIPRDSPVFELHLFAGFGGVLEVLSTRTRDGAEQTFGHSVDAVGGGFVVNAGTLLQFNFSDKFGLGFVLSWSYRERSFEVEGGATLGLSHHDLQLGFGLIF